MTTKEKLRSDSVLVEVYDERVATVTLNRPESHNALDAELTSGLTQALRTLERDPQVRVIVLAATGKSFCGGSDPEWLKRSARQGRAQHLADAMALAELLGTLNGLSKPTVARVHGAAYGAGAGLLACCDIALAARQATFALSEVRLGLTPAVVGPYFINAIGPRLARRYLLTGERFDAAEAWRIGLVQELAEAEQLDPQLETVVSQLLAGGPQALAGTKRLVGDFAHAPLNAATLAETARRSAEARAGAEAREGIGAFLDRRNPVWLEAAPPAPRPAKPRRKR